MWFAYSGMGCHLIKRALHHDQKHFSKIPNSFSFAYYTRILSFGIPFDAILNLFLYGVFRFF